MQKCEVVKSVPWDPHYGMRIVLNIDFESVVSRSKKDRIRIKLSKPTQHFGTKQDFSVYSNQVSADQRKKSWPHVGWTFLFGEPSTNLAFLRMDLFPIIFLCALRPEGFDHQEARIVGMSRQQPGQSHT